jgi:hypothetical protein
MGHDRTQRRCRLCGYNACARRGRSSDSTQGTARPSHIDPAILMQLAAHRSRQANLKKGLLSPVEVERLAPRKPYTRPENTGREPARRPGQEQSKGLLQTPPVAVHREQATRGVPLIKTRRITFELPSKGSDNAHKRQEAATERNLETENTYVCSICLEAFQEEQLVRRTPCRHEFHSHCLEQWLTSYKDRCPLCQATLRIGDMLLER